MFSTNATIYTGVYTPRQAAEFLSNELGTKISYRKYYKILRELGIINQHNLFLPPYDDGVMFWQERQDFYGTSCRHKKTHLKVFISYDGLLKVLELYKEHHNPKKY